MVFISCVDEPCCPYSETPSRKATSMNDKFHNLGHYLTALPIPGPVRLCEEARMLEYFGMAEWNYDIPGVPTLTITPFGEKVLQLCIEAQEAYVAHVFGSCVGPKETASSPTTDPEATSCGNTT